MKKPVIKSAQAISDIEQQADYIAEDNLEAATRYLLAVDAAMQSLGANPTRGSIYKKGPSKIEGLRRLIVPGFKNYLIFYYDLKDKVDIVRVLHGARDIEAIFSDEQ